MFVEDLEATIALVRRKNAEPENSPTLRFLVRQLTGLRNTREEAGPIIEDLDSMNWGS